MTYDTLIITFLVLFATAANSVGRITWLLFARRGLVQLLLSIDLGVEEELDKRADLISKTEEDISPKERSRNTWILAFARAKSLSPKIKAYKKDQAFWLSFCFIYGCYIAPLALFWIERLSGRELWNYAPIFYLILFTLIFGAKQQCWESCRRVPGAYAYYKKFTYSRAKSFAEHCNAQIRPGTNKYSFGTTDFIGTIEGTHEGIWSEVLELVMHGDTEGKQFDDLRL